MKSIDDELDIFEEGGLPCLDEIVNIAAIVVENLPLHVLPADR